MDLTRRQTLLGAAASFAASTQSVEAAKQFCPVVPDAPPAPTCAQWIVETITDPAVTSWTVPNGVSAIQVEAWGSGAGGATLGPNEDVTAGGGGAWVIKAMFPVASGQVFPLQVGRGGGTGEDGAPSTFGAGPLVYADYGRADGTGGRADNCIPTSFVAQNDDPPAYDGGYGGTSFSVTSDPTFWSLTDKSANAQLDQPEVNSSVYFSTATPGAIRSNTSHVPGSGKWFFEAGVSGSMGTLDGIGFAAGDASLGSLASAGSGGVLVRQDGKIYVNGVLVGDTGQTLNTPDSPYPQFVQVNCALDLSAMRVWFSVLYLPPATAWNGNPAADPATGVGGIDVSGVFTGKNVFTCVTSNSAWSSSELIPVYYAYWDQSLTSDYLPEGWLAWAPASAATRGAGGGGAAGPKDDSEYGDDNGYSDSVDAWSGGGDSSEGAGYPSAEFVPGSGPSSGGMSWDLSPGGKNGTSGAHGSGGGGGDIGGAGGDGTGYPHGGPGGGGGGGSATGKGGNGGKWGGGGATGTPGGSGANGCVAISYVSAGDLCNKVITPGTNFNIALSDQTGWLYYSTDSGATWTTTSAYPAAVGANNSNFRSLATGYREGNYTKWAQHAFTNPMFPPIFSGVGWPYGSVAVAPWPLSNIQGTVPLRFDEGTEFVPAADMGPALSERCVYSPNTGKIYVASQTYFWSAAAIPGAPLDGQYTNVDMRYSTDHGLTWHGLAALKGRPWLTLDARGVPVAGWHNVCISRNAQIVYVKELYGCIQKSVDGGVTWKVLGTGPAFTDAPDSDETRMECSDDGQTIAMFDKFNLKLAVSHDGGLTWIMQMVYEWVATPDIAYAYGYDFSMSDDGQVMLIKVSWDSNDLVNWHDYFFRSRNGGITWDQILPPTAQWSDPDTRYLAGYCPMSQDGNGIVVTYYGNSVGTVQDSFTLIDVSKDGGETWITQRLDLSPINTGSAYYASDWMECRIWN